MRAPVRREYTPSATRFLRRRVDVGARRPGSARFFAAAAVGGLSISAGAQAPMETMSGSHLIAPKPAEDPGRGRLSENERVRTIVYDFANCVVRRSRTNVDRFLDYKADDSQGRAFIARMAADVCLRDGQLRMPISSLRGAIFRSIYLRDFANAPPALSQIPPDFSTYVGDRNSEKGFAYLVLMEFAYCVARADLTNADNLVRAAVASSAEKDAIAALRPQLGSCLPQGLTVALNKEVIAGALAEALYREATAGQMAASSGN